MSCPNCSYRTEQGCCMPQPKESFGAAAMRCLKEEAQEIWAMTLDGGWFIWLLFFVALAFAIAQN